MRRVLVGLAAGLLLLTSVSVRAEAPGTAFQVAPAPGTPSVTGSGSGAAAPLFLTQEKSRKKGLMLALSIGVDGCNDNWCEYVDPSANFKLEVLYRILPYAAIGLHGQFALLNPNTDHYFWENAANSFLGVEGRGIFPYRKLDAWIGLAFGWTRSLGWSSETVLGHTVKSRGWMDAFGLAFGFGADYYVHKLIAVGLNFWLVKGFYEKACIWDSESNDKVCDDLSNADKNDIGIVWSLAASATFFFSL
jgi:hypothetical protein